MSTVFVALMSIALSVAAQFALKAGMSSVAVREVMAAPYTLRTALTVLSNPFVLSGFMLYGIGAIVWLGVLSKWDVSKAYPLVGLGFVLTVLIGLAAGENVNSTRTIGVFLISLGVLLVGRS
ncbi:DMT family transporter [Chitinimonas naiadis]